MAAGGLFLDESCLVLSWKTVFMCLHFEDLLVRGLASPSVLQASDTAAVNAPTCADKIARRVSMKPAGLADGSPCSKPLPGPAVSPLLFADAHPIEPFVFSGTSILNFRHTPQYNSDSVVR